MLKNPVFIETDPVDEVKGLFERLVLQMISLDRARNILHFKYVSPEWAGNPGWYFWPKSRPGVYFLRLESASGEGDQLISQWQLYYYPHPDESVFEDYSLDEQIARLSGLFPASKPEGACRCECCEEHALNDFSDLLDGVGIPGPEVRERLNSWLFCAGDMRLTWENEKIGRCIVEAPECSCTWACMDIAAKDPEGNEIPLLKRGEPDRKVPAWEICHEFAGSLLSDLQLIGIVSVLQEDWCENTAGIYRKRSFHLSQCP